MEWHCHCKACLWHKALLIYMISRLHQLAPLEKIQNIQSKKKWSAKSHVICCDFICL